MSASTETLVKLRGLTAEARSKGNVTVPTLTQRKYKSQHSYNIRMNKINALSGVAFGGNYSFVVPAFQQVVGEMFIEMTLPALTTGTYRKYPLLHVVDLISYRSGQKFYEFCPRKDLPILLNRIKDKQMKDQILDIFKDKSGAASNATNTYILPLVTPMSIFHTDRLSEPIRHGNRNGGLWDAGKLADNLHVEIQFASGVESCSEAPVVAGGANLGNVTLRWEEVVATPAVISAIKRDLPSYYCCEEFTRLEDQVVSDSATTVYKVASLVSRAGTTGFYLRARPVAADTTTLNCMAGNEHLKSLVVRCDGRDIYSTDERSDDQRKLQKILAGDPGATGEPKFAHFSFGNTHQNFDAATVGGLLKNGACNELDLEIQSETSDDRLDICAVHLRSFVFADRTVKVSNAY